MTIKGYKIHAALWYWQMINGNLCVVVESVVDGVQRQLVLHGPQPQNPTALLKAQEYKYAQDY